ncbi:MAG: hypothetical protein SynsKO_14510 [Synoicihabitans sp.]
MLGWVCFAALGGAAQQARPMDPIVEFTEVDTVATSAYVVTSTVHERDGKYFLYAGGGKSELAAFSIGREGRLTPIASYTLWKGEKRAGPARGLVTATVAGTEYLFVGNKFGNAVEVHRIKTDGSLERVFVVEDTHLTHLGVVITLEVVQIDNASFLLVGGLEKEPGLTSFLINADGSLQHVQSMKDSPEIFTDGIIGMAKYTIGSHTFLVTGGFQDSGVSSFEIHRDGTFTNISNVGDDLRRFLNGAYPVEGITLGKENFVIVGHRHHRYYTRNGFIKDPDFVYHGNGVTVFKLDRFGRLKIQSVLGGGSGINIAGQTQIQSLKLSEDRALVLIATKDGKSVQAGVLDGQGTLVPAGYETLDFGIYYAMSAVEIGERYFVIVGSTDDPRIKSYEVNFKTEISEKVVKK